MLNPPKPYRVLALAFLFITALTAASAGAFAQVISPAFAPFFEQRQQANEEQRLSVIDERLDNARRGERARENTRSRYTEHSRLTRSTTFRDQRYDAPRIIEIEEGKSALEELYSERIVEDLRQFGYEMFGDQSGQVYRDYRLYSPREHSDDYARQRGDKEEPRRQMPLGAVQDGFILGHGDELEITFTGQRSERETYTINNQGQLIIPDFPPIPAAGRTIAQLRLSVEAAARNLYNTQAFVSLSSVRQIGVLIVGHVNRPGRQNLTVFHTVLDALMEAGGVQKTGSLRSIKLVRHGRSTIVDLYALLNHGASNIDLNLRDGDRIIVPPIGPTVAISGEAKRPGIYEIKRELTGMAHDLKAASEKLSLNDMLDLGGGVLTSGQNRFLKLDLTGDGRETVNEVHDVFAPKFGDGAILMVSKGRERRTSTVELVGHTRKPGIHALEEVKTLSRLINSENVLDDDAYPLIGVIERWDDDQLASKLLSYPLRLVLKGEFDMRLRDGDVVHIFSKAQMAALSEDITANLSGTKKASRSERHRALRGEGSFREEEEELKTVIEDEIISSFLAERAAFIRGAVRMPGAYPVAPGTTLDTLLAVAGGLSLEAHIGNIEITTALNGEDGQAEGRTGTRRLSIDLRESRASAIKIEAGDAVRVNQKFSKIADNSVLVIGEVKNPGRYDLLPGDKLSDLMARAGGLNAQAYPEGAIFSRESERRAEETRFKSQARELERSIALALNNDDEKIEKAKLLEARTLAKELREAEGVGRITVEADPSALVAQPELDMLLEPGDRLFIPKRNLTVRVSGEVLSPAALQFRKSKNAMDYLNEAGGFSFHADKERTFVLYPDGSAQPLQVSSWNYSPAMIPPGSTIVVPYDPEPFDFIDSAKDISGILSNLAITAIFIDDIRDDD